MCKSNFHPFLARLPKCEQHIHLEGALTTELLFRLAARNSVELPTDAIYASAAVLQAHYDRPDAFSSLQPFLDSFRLATRVLQKEQDYYELGMTYFHRAAQDNVRHAEVFFDVQGHMSRGIPYSTVLGGFKRAQAEAESSVGMSVKLVLCFLRHWPQERALETYELARQDLLSQTISGIGLAATEVGFPPELFKDVYKRALEDGVHRTSHAGEEAGPEVVASALDNLKVERIDHGRTIPEDPEVLARVARSDTLVTLCPLSNLKLQGVKAIAQLPVRVFLDAGVRFSINSDDPAYFGGWTLDNYCAVQEAFGLSVAEWETICTNAIRCSWCGEERKQELLRELKSVIAEHAPS